MNEAPPLLSVRNLRTHFVGEEETVCAVDGLSIDIRRGETLALVGESGSGKSVASLSIMRLLDPASGRVAADEIVFEGEDLLAKSEAEMRAIRGNEIAMIFQEPMTSLNPVYTVGEQIAEAVRLHQDASPKVALRRAAEMLDLVGIPEAAKRVHVFPHEMSGGMRQRVMIAMALCCNPKLLIADEPTTALDVTIQAQILELMRTLQQQIGMSILFITHDLGVVAEIADRVVVMYAGRAVEDAPVEAIFEQPRMPYTQGLLRSVPRVDRFADEQEPLYAIPGSIPSPSRLPKGCSFHPRCPHAAEICRRSVPELERVAQDHHVRCVRWREIEAPREVPA
ncbi:ABC transporter ATP-binding protein [Roseitranquillus sediminis]|uniref:ABC transporter ATP-binding protein n=1 Tax=Roseitranquillus sediminis TaxID=2809051 RepID=UPI001D0C5BDD|nr:ABC transporter ATP-binding protein [Roseitranquillus sediminis]MBM9594770.1 ABC transporter ATP-binding protein [Roseitranquillus sediminis]